MQSFGILSLFGGCWCVNVEVLASWFCGPMERHIPRNLYEISGSCEVAVGLKPLKLDRRLGVRPTGKSFRFVSFVRACVRAVRLPSGIRSQILAPTVSLSLFGLASFPFSLPHVPQTSYPSLVGLIGTQPEKKTYYSAQL